MEPGSPSTEVILSHPRQSLGTVPLDAKYQPGSHFDLKGQTYAVLERHHHYQYKVGGYYLHKVSLYVQSIQIPTERSYVEGRWVIGDASCRFNANSEIIRCAVNPEGPCQGCRFYEPADN
ncbi:MAG: hypothetical protein BRC40_10965 [Cyanobacteria bacterium QH_8_48_120]|jgi:hypothetical protein|nr:MAG: hypothetical protein BRC34_16475 [Cyanobacteria bacterium QH_1_48_107]PSO58072.1 MAG: hypothetical protein BRC35_06450 [Cyanobacteria bacterium QH_10_48_56]PSO60680.1 MAG: hypothetical protein BRC39_09380 [Cyanobacteria bacterium QH_7_48_89]PSO62635.1 MAG: hypothetical protein BRC36_09840 [Cyanobacteria bacterium QH_2_48_84]PSO65206.1 MAG: hypothetical protein BRC38_09680 [Cyanobacteria bacterium QH_6_48_35]PSO69214.1 MAG: hypothetical protein BRC42_12345 [Cyanobacteria bacterium QS_1_